MGFLSSLVDPFGFLGGDEDELRHANPDLDPETQRLIHRQTARAARPDSDFIDEDMAGVDQRAALAATQAGQQGRERAYGGDQAALSDAIHRKASRAYSRDLGAFSGQVQRDAPLKAFAARDAATRQEANFERVRREQRAVNMRAQANEEAARNQALSQILGLAGTVGGFLLAGPAGGAAGGMVASSMSGGNTQTQKMGGRMNGKSTMEMNTDG